MVRMNDDDAPLRARPEERAAGLDDPARELAGQLARLKRIRAARRELHLLTLGLAVLAGLAALLTTLVLAFSAARLVVRGLGGGVEAALGGPAWRAELLAGVLLLGGLAAALAILFRLGERRLLRALGSPRDGRP